MKIDCILGFKLNFDQEQYTATCSQSRMFEIDDPTRVTDAAKQMPSLRVKGNARIASGARQLRASAPLALGGTSRLEMKEPRAGSER